MKKLVCRLHQLIIQKSGVGQEFIHLFLHPHDVIRVAMPNMRYIVDTVQNFIVIFFEKILTSSVLHHDRILLIRQRHHWVQELFSFFDYSVHLFPVWTQRYDQEILSLDFVSEGVVFKEIVLFSLDFANQLLFIGVLGSARRSSNILLQSIQQVFANKIYDNFSISTKNETLKQRIKKI